MEEGMKMTGVFEVQHFDREHQLANKRYVYNTITTAGKANVAALMLSDLASTATAFDYIAVGTGSGTSAKTQTALTGEVSRTAGTGTLVTSGDTNDTAQLVSATFAITTAYTLAEAGIFNASASGGTMLCRSSYAAINVTSGDSVIITYKVTLV